MIDMDAETLAAFTRNTIASVDREASMYSIRCRKGLWGVTAPTLTDLFREATHYFQQYYLDGEYDT